MLKKTVKYTGFDGEEHTEDIYMNFTRVEVLKFLVRHGISMKKGDDVTQEFKDMVAHLSESGDVEAMLNFLDDFVLSAYGVRSEDGKRFIKTKEVREKFSESLAYEALFDSILDDPALAKTLGESLLNTPGSKPTILPLV